MVVMALDHTRDFFGQTSFDPVDLDKTTPAYFFTRWITHYCAPTFVFLAGTSAWLSRSKKSDAELAVFLLKRGVWLVFLEIFVVGFCWSFDVTFSFTVLQVIWAIGWSMVFLATLVRLRPEAIASVGGAIVLFHNAFDGVHVAGKTPLHTLWSVVHDPDFGLSVFSIHFAVAYPLIPWLGVMALGYAFGSLYVRVDGTKPAPDERSRVLVRLGLALIAAFVVLRATNLYGDKLHWTPRATALGTVMSFLDVTKYPPSLCYLLMTLGPAVFLLGLFDRGLGEEEPRGFAKVLVVYGRVPLFYYVLHLALLHATSNVVYFMRTGVLTARSSWFGPQALDVGLPLTYVAWALAVALLYPPCLWFSRVKASPWGRERAWLSYL
jgi:uncharacterized membrane protein